MSTAKDTAEPVGFTEKPKINHSLRAMLGAVLARPELYELAEPFLEAHEGYIKATDTSVYLAFASIAQMHSPTGEISLVELAADIDDAAEEGVARLGPATLAKLRAEQAGVTPEQFRVRLAKVSKAAQRGRLRGLIKKAAAESDKKTYDPNEFADDLTGQISVAVTDFDDVDYGAMMGDLAGEVFDPDNIAQHRVHIGWSKPGPVTVNKVPYPSHPSDLAGIWSLCRKQVAANAAVTSGGKSVLAGAIGRNCILPASENYGGKEPRLRDARLSLEDTVEVAKRAYVLIVSTESPRRSYLDRLQADLLDCQGSMLDDKGDRQKLFTGPNKPVVEAFKLALSGGRLTIIDRHLIRGKNKTVSGREVHLISMHVRRWARQVRAKHGDVDLLCIVDYGQKCELSPAESKGLDPKAINKKVASTICDLAADLDMAMLVMLQLNGRLGRNNVWENDIGEASDWEKDVDLVLKLDALNKDEVYALKELGKSGEPPNGWSDAFVADACALRQIINPKARHGAGGYGSWLYFDAPHTRMVSVPNRCIPIIAEGNPIARARQMIAAAKRKKAS